MTLFDITLIATTLLCALTAGLILGFAVVVMPGIANALRIGEYKKLLSGNFDNDFMTFLKSRHQSFIPLIESLERALEMASQDKDFSL